MKPRTELDFADVAISLAEQPRRHRSVPTLQELKAAYPHLLRRVVSNVERPHLSYAELVTPYGGDVLLLMRSVKGARWDREQRCWCVPQWSSRRLGEVLFVLSTRSK